MVLSFLTMVPFIILAEKKQRVKTVFLMSVTITVISQLLLAFTHQHWLSICLFTFFYFVAFNILEASLPSLVSKQADAEGKGTAMGIYSSCQFLGIFAGGACAGFVYQLGSNKGIFMLNAVIGLLWLAFTAKMKPANYQTTLIVSYPIAVDDTHQLTSLLCALPGIVNVVIAEREGVIYLRINKALYHMGSAEQLLDETQPTTN